MVGTIVLISGSVVPTAMLRIFYIRIPPNRALIQTHGQLRAYSTHLPDQQASLLGGARSVLETRRKLVNDRLS
jgi:hypothetical protein